jgi:hypothetical protein
VNRVQGGDDQPPRSVDQIQQNLKAIDDDLKRDAVAAMARA